MRQNIFCVVLIILLVIGSSVFASGVVSYAQIALTQTGTWGGTVAYTQNTVVDMDGANYSDATNALYCRLVTAGWKWVKTERIYDPSHSGSWEYTIAVTGNYCVENNPEGPSESGCHGYTQSEDQ